MFVSIEFCVHVGTDEHLLACIAEVDLATTPTLHDLHTLGAQIPKPPKLKIWKKEAIQSLTTSRASPPDATSSSR